MQHQARAPKEVDFCGNHLRASQAAAGRRGAGRRALNAGAAEGELKEGGRALLINPGVGSLCPQLLKLRLQKKKEGGARE